MGYVFETKKEVCDMPEKVQDDETVKVWIQAAKGFGVYLT